MPDMIPLNSIDADTPAAAEEVDHNFDLISDFVNSQLINRDGTVAMEAPLDLFGDPSQDSHAARKAYVDALIPIGAIFMWGANTAPAGAWRLCNGASVSKATYPRLFDTLQYRYGGTGGSFNLPNFQGRLAIGLNTALERFDNTGNTGGTFNVPLRDHFHEVTHDHAAFDSGVEDANHYHKLVHTHTINHNHPNEAMTTSEVGDHNHAVKVRTGPIPGAGPLKYVVEASDINFNSTGTLATAATGDHQHSLNVDLDVTTGLVSGAASDEITTVQTDSAGTAGATARHHHSINVPSSTVDSEEEGVDVVSPGTGLTVAEQTTNTAMYPPYVVITFIIRTDDV